MYAEPLLKLPAEFTENATIPDLGRSAGTTEIWLNGIELDVARTDAFR